MMTLATVLFLVALILGIVELARSRAQSLLCWAVVLIALGLTLGVLRGL
jgi:hypothetical protein